MIRVNDFSFCGWRNPLRNPLCQKEQHFASLFSSASISRNSRSTAVSRSCATNGHKKSNIYIKSSRFFVRNAWMWNMSWRCEFCLQIKKIHQTKKCIKFVNRSLRNHLLKSPLKGIHIHIHRCWWHRRRIIGVFFRYRRKMHKTRNTSLQNCNEKHGINCVSYSKARETPPFCGFLRNLHVVCPSHWGSSKENWL